MTAIASLLVEIGDSNNNDRADVALTLTMFGKTLAPIVVDMPSSSALSLVTGIFDGARTGLRGIALGALGVLGPTLASLPFFGPPDTAPGVDE